MLFFVVVVFFCWGFFGVFLLVSFPSFPFFILGVMKERKRTWYHCMVLALVKTIHCTSAFYFPSQELGKPSVVTCSSFLTNFPQPR